MLEHFALVSRNMVASVSVAADGKGKENDVGKVKGKNFLPEEEIETEIAAECSLQYGCDLRVGC